MICTVFLVDTIYKTNIVDTAFVRLTIIYMKYNTIISGKLKRSFTKKNSQGQHQIIEPNSAISAGSAKLPNQIELCVCNAPCKSKSSSS